MITITKKQISFYFIIIVSTNRIPTVARLCAYSAAETHQLCTNVTGKNVFKCDSCETDGCNGAAQYGPVALFVVVPVAIAKFFTF